MGELDFFEDYSELTEEDEAEAQAEAEYQDYVASVHHAASL